MKSGWGTSGGSGAQASNIGIQKKSNAAQYWDNKTTELMIPEMEMEQAEEVQVNVVEPPRME